MNVLITGATGGLGRAVTLAFWNAGANLLLAGRSSDALLSLKQSLPAGEGRSLYSFACDLAEPGGVDNLIACASKCFPCVDVLVNNAAVLGPAGPVQHNDWEAWETAVRVNLLAPVKLCRGLIPRMRRGSSIVNISGGGAASPRPNFSAYAASKAALVRFSETLAIETAPRGIRVNCVAPGIMRTHMVEQVVTLGAARTGDQEFGKAREVLRTGGTPPETAARLMVMLASEAGAGITGKLLSAAWDVWEELPNHAGDLCTSDVYTLRRILPADRGLSWGA